MERPKFWGLSFAVDEMGNGWPDLSITVLRFALVAFVKVDWPEICKFRTI